MAVCIRTCACCARRAAQAECNLFTRDWVWITVYVADGNDIASLIEAFKAGKGQHTAGCGAHQYTQKGKGYAPAEQHKERMALLWLR